jgi:hypothetical protein
MTTITPPTTELEDEEDPPAGSLAAWDRAICWTVLELRPSAAIQARTLPCGHATDSMSAGPEPLHVTNTDPAIPETDVVGPAVSPLPEQVLWTVWGRLTPDGTLAPLNWASLMSRIWVAPLGPTKPSTATVALLAMAFTDFVNVVVTPDNVDGCTAVQPGTGFVSTSAWSDAALAEANGAPSTTTPATTNVASAPRPASLVARRAET